MYLTQGLHRAVQSTPDAVATVFGDRERTFREHVDRIARFAGALQGLGVQSGGRVAMLSLNSDRYAEYLLAVPWADAVLNPVNIRWSPREIAYSLNDSGTEVLLVDDTFVPGVAPLREACPGVHTFVYCGEAEAPEGTVSYEELVAGSDHVPDARRSDDEIAGVFYTGGTTGFPKGVMLSHKNLVTSALGTVATGELLSGEARFMHAAPMFHLADLAAWAGQVLLGGPHIMIPAFEPKAMLEAIEKHRPTDVLVVPTMLQLLVDHPAVAEHDLSSMQRILYGGSPIGEGLATRTLKLFPGVRMTQAYGMTEVSPVATLLLPDDHKGATIRSGGRAAPHSEIQVIDAEGLPVPAGAVGEVCVRGGHVMLGYWNKPEETADVLVDGWYRTGDLGYVDEEGFLFLVDRLKDMIVTGGENVYSAEVESALSKHPAVAQSAVIGIPNDRWGETVHAVIVLKDGAEVTVEELQGFCREHIAGYKAPRSIEFAAELPMSGAGKILKRELRKALVESPA